MSAPNDDGFRKFVREIERYIVPRRKSRWNFVLITLAITVLLVIAAGIYLVHTALLP